MRADDAIGRVVAALGGVVLAAAAITVAAAEDLRARGAYLVNTVGACGNCHTPRNASGQVMADRALAGGFSFDTHDPGIGVVTVPNITPDKETGIGEWSATQIIEAMRNGKRPDGTLIGPPMPIALYRELSDRDASAIAAYLLSLKPIHHDVPERNQYKIALPPDYGPPITHVGEPDRSDKVAYGGYLAAFAHCVVCHTQPGKGTPLDMSRAFAGGRDLRGTPDSSAVVVSRNITPDPDHGIGKWSDAQIKHAIVAGVRPDGTKLVRTMAFDWYAKMTPADLDDIVAYLRTLKPMK